MTRCGVTGGIRSAERAAAEAAGSDGEANGKWKRPANRCGAFSSFVDLTGQLAQRTKDNSALRIFAAAGDNDLVTSYVTMKYMLEHSGIASEHLTINDYPGGHMMYLQVHRGREVAAGKIFSI